MKTLRYILPALVALMPALSFAQAASDSVVVVIEGVLEAPGRTSLFGAQFQQGVNVGPATIAHIEPDIGCVSDPTNPEADANGFIPAVDNPEALAGNIAVITRGSCTFVTKVKAAAQAGAIAAVIYNSSPDNACGGSTCGPDGITAMSGDCTIEQGCSIPAANVSYNSGAIIAAEAEFGSEATVIPIRITAPPPPATAGTLDTGVMQLSIYDYGFIGANASFGAEGGGAPFTFNDIEGGLFVATVLVGQDGVVNTNPYAGGPPEFVAETDVTSITPPAPFDQAFQTSFSSAQLGVLVTERAYARANDPFVVIELDVTNTSGADLNDVYIGLFSDWDIVDEAGDGSTDDLGGVNEDLSLVYVYDETMTQYYGVTALGTSLSGYTTTAAGEDEDLFEALSSPVENPTTAQERATVNGTGPYNIPAGTSVTVRFAYVGGTSEAELISNTETVQSLGVATEQTTPLGTYVLEAAYPNPFAVSTAIGFAIPTAQHVRLAVYDVLGRRVATLVDEARPAGAQSVRFDASALPSGMYFYRLDAGSAQLVQRLTVIR